MLPEVKKKRWHRYIAATRYYFEGDYIPIINKINKKYEAVLQQRKIRQDKKLDKQKTHASTNIGDNIPNKTVINLSNRQLSLTESQLLQKWLNFAVAPTQIPNLDIIVAIETSLCRIPEAAVEEIGWKVKSILDILNKGSYVKLEEDPKWSIERK